MSPPFWSDDPAVLVRGDQLAAFYPTASMSADAKLNSLVRLAFYAAVVLALFGVSYLVFYLPLLALLGTYGMHAMRSRGVDPLAAVTGLVRRATGAIGATGVTDTDPEAADGVEGFSLFDDSVATGQYPNVPDALQHAFPSSQFHRVNASVPTTPPPRVPGELAAADGSPRKCTPSTVENPFMNVLVTDVKFHPTRPAACTEREEAGVREHVEANFDARRFRDQGDVWAHAGGQRQFFTMPWTTVPNDQEGDFGQWLYDGPPTKKEQGLVQRGGRRPNGLL